GAHVDEDGNSSEDNVTMTPYAVFLATGRAVLSRHVDARELEKSDGEAEDDERKRDGEIRKLDCGSFMQTVKMKLLGRHCTYVLRVLGSAAQDEPSAKKRTDDRAERVERLREIQTARCCRGWSEHRDIWIGGYLQCGDSGSQDDEGGKKERE